MKTKKGLMLIIAVAFMSLFFCGIALAADVVLRWDPNDTPPDGYRVFVRGIDAKYDYADQSNQVGGTVTTYTVQNLTAGSTYAFVVRAFVGKNESGDSNEVVYTIPIAPPHQIVIPARVGGITILFQPLDQSSGK
jgi:hypothetical protein